MDIDEPLEDTNYLDNVETLIRLCSITQGDLRLHRNEIKKSLITSTISTFPENSEISLKEISEKFFQITRSTISDDQIISILEELENEKIIQHLSNLNYKIIKTIRTPDFFEICEPVWAEFQSTLSKEYPKYDIFIHKNSKTVFFNLILRILYRFSISKPLDNLLENISIEDLRGLIKLEVNKFNYPDKNFNKKFETILLNYFSSNPKQLIELIVFSYQGIINIDLISREQEMPFINFEKMVKFLIIDTNFIIPLICNNDHKYPLSVAVIKRCNSLNIPVFYLSKTKDEMNGTINQAILEAKNFYSKKINRSQILNNFFEMNNLSDISWNNYETFIKMWEVHLKTNFNIILYPNENSVEVDEDTYEIAKKALPFADNFRYLERSKRNDIEYEPRTRDTKRYEHDSYCLGKISSLQKKESSSNNQISGPLFLSYDDLIGFVNSSNYFSFKNSIIGLSIQPRILLNYFLAYSKIDFNEKDKEQLGIAILQYTVRIKQTKLTLKEYSKLVALKSGFEESAAEIILEIFLSSPYKEELERSLNFDDTGNPDEIFTKKIMTNPEIHQIIQEAIYSKKLKKQEKEKNQELSRQLKEMSDKYRAEKTAKEALEKIHSPDITINTNVTIHNEIDIKITNRLNTLIEALQNEGAFENNTIPAPPKEITLENAQKWIEGVKNIVDTGKNLQDGILALSPLITLISKGLLGF